jgi:hypothetical protein
MPSRLRPHEETARRIVQRTLGRNVEVNDDGTAPGLYDLRIGPRDAPEVAIECVGAVDPVSTQTWNIGPAKGPLSLPLLGDWVVVIHPNARVKVLRSGLPELLRMLESVDIPEVWDDLRLRRFEPSLHSQMVALGIKWTHRIRFQGQGKVHLTMEGRGGFVDETGAALAQWFGEFLRESAQADVLFKLQRSGAPSRHVFITEALNGAPWPVESYLFEPESAPRGIPILPFPITAAWVVPTHGSRGVYWDGCEWQLVATRGEGIDRPSMDPPALDNHDDSP